MIGQTTWETNNIVSKRYIISSMTQFFPGNFPGKGKKFPLESPDNPEILIFFPNYRGFPVPSDEIFSKANETFFLWEALIIRKF